MKLRHLRAEFWAGGAWTGQATAIAEGWREHLYLRLCGRRRGWIPFRWGIYIYRRPARRPVHSNCRSFSGVFRTGAE